MDLRLLVLQGKPQGKELPIRQSPFLIGRGPECHLRPNSDMVSRRHCALIIHGDKVHIRDLGSTNGTIVDGERLTEDWTLTDGDIFQVGPLVFQVVIRAGAVPEHPAADGTVPRVAHGHHEGVANQNPDEIMQWLIGDSKNDIPTSGSGVYSGETVFTTGAPEKHPTPEQEAAEPAADASSPAATANSQDHTRPKEVVKQKAVESTGAAAHAAEDMLRQFLHRRPHG